MKPVNDRRLSWPVPANESNVFTIIPDYGFKNKLLDWIEEYTVGEFYIGFNVLHFVEDQDAMMYKLCDIEGKMRMWREVIFDKPTAVRI